MTATLEVAQTMVDILATKGLVELDMEDMADKVMQYLTISKNFIIPIMVATEDMRVAISSLLKT